MDRIKYIINILIVALLLASIAINKDSRILGQTSQEILNPKEEEFVEIEQTLEDGTRVINSTSLARGVLGFGGRTPIKLYIKDDIIQKVEALSHSETPSFFKQVKDSKLLNTWDNKNINDVSELEVNAISGATYTSVALIENVKSAANYASSADTKAKNPLSGLTLKTFFGLMVLLSGVVLSFIKDKNKHIKNLQLALNVIVLGFWCGSFLSLSQVVSWLANGVNLSLAIVSFCMLLIVILMPLFGKKGTYCAMHCPMGSAQELLSKLPTRKWKFKQRTNKFLNKLRYYILFLLMFIMWLGVGFELMNYEVFSAFLLGSASNVVLVMALVFLALSPFIHRPYCRFICPTGALITISSKTKE
ncbi:MAG: 4Fe-4S binding protein [Rikenellaceae bacterium]